MPVTNNGKIPHSWKDRDRQRNSLVSGINTSNKGRFSKRMQVDLSRDFSSNSNKQKINHDKHKRGSRNLTTTIRSIQLYHNHSMYTRYTHSAKHPLVRPMNDQRCVVHCLNVSLLMSSATIASFSTSLTLPLSTDLTESLPL